MSTTDFDLNNLSDNPEDLVKAFEALENGGDIEIPEPKPQDTPNNKADDKQADGQDNGNTQKTDEQNQGEVDPQGIATKDGKHVIPYSVLKNERERATRAEQIAKEAEDRVTALEQQLQQATQGANNGEGARTDQQSSTSDLSDEDLETLKEDFPTVYKAVMASMAAAKALETKLAPIQESVREAETERAQSVTESVQDAIDSVPKLAFIQSNNQEAFDLAKEFDTILRARPAWANRPLSERFAKVTEMVEAELGTIELPGAAPSLSAQEMKDVAKAKAAQASKGSNVPTSLSEFPAGQHAAQDEREAAENMTALQLAEKFGSMSPDQMDAYFNSL